MCHRRVAARAAVRSLSPVQARIAAWAVREVARHRTDSGCCRIAGKSRSAARERNQRNNPTVNHRVLIGSSRVQLREEASYRNR